MTDESPTQETTPGRDGTSTVDSETHKVRGVPVHDNIVAEGKCRTDLRKQTRREREGRRIHRDSTGRIDALMTGCKETHGPLQMTLQDEGETQQRKPASWGRDKGQCK